MATILPESFFPLDPLPRFMLVILVILTMPRVMERLKLPGLVGLILGGLLLGPNGLHIITEKSDVIHFLADIGLLMVMFFAGLEIDFEKFARNAHKSVIYGIATFAIPLAVGLVIGRLFGFSWTTSVLIGSLLASHTLLALPLLMKYGVIKRQSVTVTIGATVFTDIAALMVLAVCVAIHTVGLSLPILTIRLVGMIVFIPLILVGTRMLAPWFLKKMHKRKNSQALLILLLVTIAAVASEAIHLEGIVGAFIVGLAIGEAARAGAIREKLNTIGHMLFVPMFFLIVGTLIDPGSFLRLKSTGLGFMFIIVATLLATKFLAALVAGGILKYKKDDILCMWSLSVPQVAATMAAALVAYESINSAGERLINESILDGILVLVMITSILGPIMTQRFIKRLPVKT